MGVEENELAPVTSLSAAGPSAGSSSGEAGASGNGGGDSNRGGGSDDVGSSRSVSSSKGGSTSVLVETARGTDTYALPVAPGLSKAATPRATAGV